MEVQENPTDKLIRELKSENEKLKRLLKEAGGDVATLDAAAKAGSFGDAPPPNTLTEDDLQKEIAKAVQGVEGVSDSDKAKAMAEVERQLNARNEALAENKLTQEDMQARRLLCACRYVHV